MNLNKVILIGRLTRDPDLRSLPSGQSVCSFGLATNRVFKNKMKEKQEETEFHNIVLFGRSAEIASQYLQKGSLAMIEGRLHTRTWLDKTTGAQRSITEIIGERLQLGAKTNNQRTFSSQKTTGPTDQEIPIIEEDEEIDIRDIPL